MFPVFTRKCQTFWNSFRKFPKFLCFLYKISQMNLNISVFFLSNFQLSNTETFFLSILTFQRFLMEMYSGFSLYSRNPCPVISAVGVCFCCATSVVEVIDVCWALHWDQLARSAPGPADNPIPLRRTVPILENDEKQDVATLV